MGTKTTKTTTPARPPTNPPRRGPLTATDAPPPGLPPPAPTRPPLSNPPGKFARVDPLGETGVGGTSDVPLGDPACLLVGFSPLEAAAFRALMDGMGADFVAVGAATEASLDRSLIDVFSANSLAALPISNARTDVGGAAAAATAAVAGGPGGADGGSGGEAGAIAPRRTVFLSGLTAGEVVEVVSACGDAVDAAADGAAGGSGRAGAGAADGVGAGGLGAGGIGATRPVFAVMVPRNKDRIVRSLIDEVWDDDARLTARGGI